MHANVSVATLSVMSGIYRVTDFFELAAGNAAMGAVQNTLESVGAATTAGASAITPPGSEGASVRAVAQQQAAVTQYGAMFTAGMEMLRQRLMTTTTWGGVAEATEAASAAAVMV